MTLLLGIDEGTSAVKAILFDADLRPLREARREKPLHHPRPGWVEQDPEDVVEAVVEAVAEVLTDAPGEVVACGLDHQGESVLAWDAETGRALTPVVTWQDKRSQEVLDRLEQTGMAERIQELQRPAARPLLLGRKAGVAARARRGSAHGAREAGTLRMGTVDSFLCDRLGAGFYTDPSTASRTQLGAPEWDAQLLEIFGVPRGGAARRSSTPPATSARCGTRPGRASCRCARGASDQQAALAGAGCVEPGRTKATYGTGVFVLANVGHGAARRARAGFCRPSRGESTERSSGRSTAGCSPPVRCSSGSRATSGSRADPPALRAAGRARSRTQAACGCCRRSRVSARRGGAPPRAASSRG